MKYPTDQIFFKLFMDMFKQNNNGKTPRASGLFMFGQCFIYLWSVDFLEELFLTKNKFYTKHEIDR